MSWCQKLDRNIPRYIVIEIWDYQVFLSDQNNPVYTSQHDDKTQHIKHQADTIT